MRYATTIKTEVSNEDGDVYLRINDGAIDVYVEEKNNQIEMTVITYKHYNSTFNPIDGSGNPPEEEAIEHETFLQFVSMGQIVGKILEIETEQRITAALEYFDWQCCNDEDI